MRQIKFRVWDSERKQMYNLSENRFSFGLFEGHRAISWEDVFAEQHEELIPLQYTGLKDKNGREIYEGDILEDGIKIEYGVTSCGCCFYVHGYDLGGYDPYWGLPPVIGNIYENPELLEV